MAGSADNAIERLADDLRLPVLVGARRLRCARSARRSASSFSTTRPVQRIALPRCVMPWKRTSKLAQLRLRRPPRQQAPQPGHAQHAWANTSGMPDPAREVDVDVDRVVVARAPANRASVCGPRRQLQRRQFVADATGRRVVIHRSVRSSVAADQHRAQLGDQLPRWLVAREVLTTNSSAPFFFS